MRAASVVLGVALALGLPLQAQVLYRWTDDSGRVQYSDQPPKNFKGEVTRLEPPDPPQPVPRAAPGAPPPTARVKEPERATPKAPPDLATTRRATREALGERLTLARENLDRARKALADAGGPSMEESQVVQQVQTADAGGMHGLSVQRSNCSPILGKDGKQAGVMCPALVPNEQYFERMSKLDEAVKRAENEVAEAEQAYRRGVD